MVVLSDGAGPLDILAQAACWVHAERPLTRRVPLRATHRQAIEFVQAQLGGLYKDLKLYQRQPGLGGKEALAYRFDGLVGQETDFPSINGVRKEMRQHKADRLRVRDRPEVPLHNNGTESDLREYVKKRKVSGGTRREAGRRCRDTFTSLKKTCRQLGVCFWSYLRDRVGGPGQVPRRRVLLRQRAKELAAGKAQAVLT